MVFKQVTNLIFTQCSFPFLFSSFPFFVFNQPFSFRNGHRPSTYAPQDYANDVGSLIKAMEANDGIPNKNMLICPSVATGPWTPEQVWDTGFLDVYSSYLSGLAVEQ